MKITFLGSDILFFLTLGCLAIGLYRAQQRPLTRIACKKLFHSKTAIMTLSILVIYLGIALLDSIHFQRKIDATSESNAYSAKVESVLDVMFGNRALPLEKTYSAPFALKSFLKEVKPSGGQYYPKLNSIAPSIKDANDRNKDILLQFLLCVVLSGMVGALLYWRWGQPHLFESLWFSTLVFIMLLCVRLEHHYHILGTDKIGLDVFYQTIKSIRTGLVIGLITTLVTLPFAVVLGLSAGFFGGKLDDLIQYLYITISSIPGVLLIAASVLSMQVFIANHPDLFTTLISRSDARLVALCVILGLTGWTSLCRVLRAETLKIREIDYIQAAKVLGSSSRTILFKHILPNVMHVVLIAIVLDFSFLVLAEAVLSYIGVGVSSLTISWGNMINGARLELSRDPLVWWPMLAAFIFMFIFVLSTNLLADKVRDLFDPRSAEK